MELFKVNTLTEAATNLLRENLIEMAVDFKQLGTAFLMPEKTGWYKPDVFKGLWIGTDANMEIEEVNDFDRAQELYRH